MYQKKIYNVDFIRSIAVIFVLSKRSRESYTDSPSTYPICQRSNYKADPPSKPKPPLCQRAIPVCDNGVCECDTRPMGIIETVRSLFPFF